MGTKGPGIPATSRQGNPWIRLADRRVPSLRLVAKLSAELGRGPTADDMGGEMNRAPSVARRVLEYLRQHKLVDGVTADGPATGGNAPMRYTLTAKGLAEIGKEEMEPVSDAIGEAMEDGFMVATAPSLEALVRLANPHCGTCAGFGRWFPPKVYERVVCRCTERKAA